MKPSCDKMGEVHTSEKIISRGFVEWRDEMEKGSLWLLLLRQALQENSFGKGAEKSNW